MFTVCLVFFIISGAFERNCDAVPRKERRPAAVWNKLAVKAAAAAAVCLKLPELVWRCEKSNGA